MIFNDFSLVSMILEAWALVLKNLRFAFVAQNLVKSWVCRLLRSDLGCVCESLLESMVLTTSIFNGFLRFSMIFFGFRLFSSVFHDFLRFSITFFGFR